MIETMKPLAVGVVLGFAITLVMMGAESLRDYRNSGIDQCVRAERLAWCLNTVQRAHLGGEAPMDVCTDTADRLSRRLKSQIPQQCRER